MIDVLTNIGFVLSPIFYKLLYMSIVGSIAGVFIALLTKIFDNKISARWKCILWMISLLFLIVPINRIQIDSDHHFEMSATIEKVEDTFTNMSLIDGQYINTNLNQRIDISSQNNQCKNYMIFNIGFPLIWLAGCIIGIIQFLFSHAYLLFIIYHTKKVQSKRIQEILTLCQKQLKIHRDIEIRLQTFQQSPCIYGLIHPQILITEKMMEYDDEMIKNILMHELSHYKRKDMIVHNLMFLICVVHWFNPLIYLFCRTIREEMELATDEVVLNQMNKEEKKQYGMTLISLLNLYIYEKNELKLLSMVNNYKSIERRIRKIKKSINLYKTKSYVVISMIVLISLFMSPFFIKSEYMRGVLEKFHVNEITDYFIEVDALSTKLSEEKNAFALADDKERPIGTSYQYTNIKNDNESYDLLNMIIGQWKPFKAEFDEQAISLSHAYEGDLILNEDGTYTKLTSFYSFDLRPNLIGFYYLKGKQMYSNTLDGHSQKLRYAVKDNEIVLIEKQKDGTDVYFKKVS